MEKNRTGRTSCVHMPSNMDAHARLLSAFDQARISSAGKVQWALVVYGIYIYIYIYIYI